MLFYFVGLHRYLQAGNGNVKEAIRLARAESIRLEQKEMEKIEKERQRKHDALEIQRILLEQQRQASRVANDDHRPGIHNHKYNHNNLHNTDTELTFLTGGSQNKKNINNNNNTSSSTTNSNHGSLFLDQPVDEADEIEKGRCGNHSSLAGCCACVVLVIFEWIRLSIHIA